MSNSKVCPSCGAIVSGNISSCSSCGAYISSGEVSGSGEQFLAGLGDDEKTAVTTYPPSQEEFEEEAKTVRAEGFSLEEMSQFINSSPSVSSDLWNAADQWNSSNWATQSTNYPPPPQPIEETPGGKKARGSTLFYFITVAIVLASIGAAVGFLIIPRFGKDQKNSIKISEKKEKKNKIITLELDTKPSGATVWIDGKKHPEKTPTIINVLEKREVNIQLYKKGHRVIDFKWIAEKPDKREFILSPIEEREESSEKEKSSKKGEDISSEKKDARKTEKKVKKREISSVPPPPPGPGRHLGPTFPRESGGPSFINTSRVRLFIKTKPPGARVVINKKRVLRGRTPLSFSWPKGEKVEISIQKYGYQEVYFIWKARENESKVIELIPYSWYNP